ncbi:MAG TPA: hypothetical protein VHL11_17465, partial [Phototrophicaceae bacterium]|nr:hypothetical protein [Phototrophicaceae bacterium]
MSLDTNTGNKRVKILYIGGTGRSGSTLIDIMLGKLPAFFSAGELYWIWKRSLKENQLCGDGHTFKDSEFWQKVGQDAFGGWDQLGDPDHLLDVFGQVNRIRHIS